MKKIIYSLLMICIIFISTGCGNKTIDKSLSSIMKEVYKGIDKDEIPALENVKVTSKNQTYYLGDIDVPYKEALASEPKMSSVAHSVVLVRLNGANDADKMKKAIKEKIDPRKWVCVGVEEVKVLSDGCSS